MAKKASKTTQAQVSPVAAFVAAFVTVLTQQGAQAEENAKQNATRSAAIVALIAELYAAFKGDAKGYLAAVADALGNGLRGKANEPGKVAAQLKDAKVTALCVRTTLSHARTIANNWGKANVRKVASESGLRAGYDEAKPAKGEAESSSKGETAAPVTLSLAEVLGVEFERIGGAAILAMVASLYRAHKDTIRAAAVDECKVRVAMK
jgi:hypothetical protein